ncbi:hypothetical protein KKG24_04235, partial [Patescibacteria group bacterium]|nr:hypothetical protein [Patescibacteria group bacterium]
WTMGGFSVVPKAPNYSSLIEIVNPTDIQSLAAERYLQYLALGVNSWNVDMVELEFLRAYADLGVLCKLSGAKVKMLAGSPDVIDMVASPEDVTTYSALDYSLFSQLSPIVRTGDDFEVALVTLGRWVVISFTGEITELEVYHRLADGLSLLTDAGGTELSSSGIGDEKVYSLTLPNGIIGGSPSSPVEIRFTAPIKDIGTSGLWSLFGGTGINNIELSLNGMVWYTSAQLKAGVGLGGTLQGAVKSFFLRVNPEGGTLGSKQVSLKKFITVGE